MQSGRWNIAIGALLASALCGTASASSTLPHLSKLDLKSALKSSPKGEAALVITGKANEIKELSAKAKEITASIAKVAGNSVGNDETVAVMQELVDQLKMVNERLDRLNEDVESLKGWVEGQNENLPIMATDLEGLKANKGSTYVQFQYRDTTSRGSGFTSGRDNQGNFAFRRIRIGSTQKVDAKTSIKYSFDAATGTEQNAFQLRDAILIYDIVPSDVTVGTQLAAGQQGLILGYELGRSSSEREFPERATYNRMFFDGERHRGLVLTHGLGEHMLVQAGLGSSLTYNDGEQRGLATAPQNKLAGSFAVRYFNDSVDAGISHFQGERPSLTTTNTGAAAVTHPELTRRFWYADVNVTNFLVPNLLFRAEGMIGHDRRPINRTGTSFPTAPRGGADVSGYQVQLGYNLNARNQIFTRYAISDMNTDTDFNSVREYGIAYRYYLNPGAMLTMSYEIFEDQGATNTAGRNDRKYQVLTARYQFKF